MRGGGRLRVRKEKVKVVEGVGMGGEMRVYGVGRKVKVIGEEGEGKGEMKEVEVRKRELVVWG